MDPLAEDMFDNGSFLRRRKRYKRTNLDHGLPFPATVFNPFTPFWVRKPVPIFPIQFGIGNESSVGNFISTGLQENFDLLAAADNSCMDVLKEKQTAQYRDSAAVHTKLYNNAGNLDLLRRNISVLTNNSTNIADIEFNHDVVISKNDLFLNFNRKSYFLNRQNNADNYSKLSNDVEVNGSERQEQYYSGDHMDNSFDKIDVEYEEENGINDINLSDTELMPDSKSAQSTTALNEKKFAKINQTKTLSNYTSEFMDKHDEKLLMKLYSHQSNMPDKDAHISNSSSEITTGDDDVTRVRQLWNRNMASQSFLSMSPTSNKRSCDESSNHDYEYELRKKVSNIRSAKYFSIENLIGKAINNDNS